MPISLEAKNEEKPDIRITAEIEKTGFTGEVFTYKVSLCSTSPDISNVRVVKSPGYPEGINVIQGAVNTSRPEKISLKGKTYYRWTILRNFIISSKAGKFKIGEADYVVFIPHEKIVYHNFWGNRRTVDYEEVKIGCNAVDFKVSPLPENKAGKDFSGGIGEFKIDGWFPPGKISKGREAYVVFSISGQGNLKEMKLPNIYKIFNENCHLREVEQSEEQVQREGKLYSEVTLTCKFMPEEEEFSIAPLSIEFFDPDTKRYYTASSEFLRWTSQPSTKSTNHSREAIEI